VLGEDWCGGGIIGRASNFNFRNYWTGGNPMRKSLENTVGSMQGRAFIRPDRLELALLARVFDVRVLQRNHILSSQKYNRPMCCSKTLALKKKPERSLRRPALGNIQCLEAVESS
jgi:hypothetical protein